MEKSKSEAHMTQLDQFEEVLRGKEILYEIIKHEHPIKTAREGAAYFGIEIGQTAPALIAKSGGDYYTLIISGDRGRVDLEEAAKRLGCESLQLASPKEVRQLTGFTVGTIPLALTLPCMLDRRLFRYSFIYGGTGESGSTLKIPPHALEQLNRVVAYLD